MNETEINNSYKFFAFISYRHTDVGAAKKLQSLLEGYNLPSEVKAQVKDVPERFKVFRDTDELTSGVLSVELQKKLDESKFLIVICSPNSAQSKYVGEEIAYFRQKGREDKIIPFIIDGVPHSERDCFHPQLTLNGLELLGIDVQTETEQGWQEWFYRHSYFLRFHKAFIRTVAKMLELDFDVLWNRRKRKLVGRFVSMLILAFAILSSIAYFATKAQNAQPFDATIALNEVGIKTALPLSNDGRDSVFVFLENNDKLWRKFPITSLRQKLTLSPIPGQYKNEPVRIVCRAFGCHTLDTIVNLTEKVSLNISRDPEIYGRIRYWVFDNDGTTAVVGAVFDFGCIKATTDARGLLDVLIPLEHQQECYDAEVVHNGKKRYLYEPIEPFLNRREPSPLVLK